MEYDKSIHHNPDAQVWTKFFIETTKDMDRDAFRDEGYMISWFANAMMAMHDYLYTKEIERLREELARQSVITVDYIIEKRKLESDNEKMRKTLQKIAVTEPESDGNGDWWHMIIARTALKGDE
jgi:hypothetical protein